MRSHTLKVDSSQVTVHCSTIIVSQSKTAVFKVIILGSCNVGKTSIITRYVKRVFDEKSKATVGVDLVSKALTKEDLRTRSTSEDGFMGQSGLRQPRTLLNDSSNLYSGIHLPSDGLLSGEDVVLQIWDTTGQETYKSLNKQYFRGVHGIVLVCDLCDPTSLQQLEGWLKDFLENAGKEDTSDYAFILMANKSDLARARVPQTDLSGLETEHREYITDESLVSWCQKQAE